MPRFSNLQNTDLTSHIKDVKVGGELHVGLLLSIGTDKGVDTGGLNIIKLVDSLLDLPLVGLNINNKDEGVGVVFLNLLHGGFSGQGVLDNTELVEFVGVRDGSTGILGVTSEPEGLRLAEVNRGPDGLVDGGPVAQLSSSSDLLGMLGPGLLDSLGHLRRVPLDGKNRGDLSLLGGLLGGGLLGGGLGLALSGGLLGRGLLLGGHCG